MLVMGDGTWVTVMVVRGWVKIQDVKKQQNDRSIVLDGRTNNGATFPFQTQFNHQNGNRRHFGHTRRK